MFTVKSPYIPLIIDRFVFIFSGNKTLFLTAEIKKPTYQCRESTSVDFIRPAPGKQETCILWLFAKDFDLAQRRSDLDLDLLLGRIIVLCDKLAVLFIYVHIMETDLGH